MADALGLPGALRRASEDHRCLLGGARSLSALEEEFVHSPSHCRKARELVELGHTHFRRVRGDGNCFFRALCFAWVEALTNRADCGQVLQEPLPGGWPEEAFLGDLEEEYKSFRALVLETASGRAESGRELLEGLLTNFRLDLCAVAVVRLVVASFLRKEAERGIEGAGSGRDAGAGLSAVGADLSLQAAQHGSITNYLRSQVLPMGCEAEGTTIVAAALQLGVRVVIAQFDNLPGPVVQYKYPPEDCGGSFVGAISLLFRPGHYEVLYHRDSFRFTAPSSVRATCSFCLSDANLEDALPCAHCLCASCGAQVKACPLCAEVAPPEWATSESVFVPEHVVIGDGQIPNNLPPLPAPASPPPDALEGWTVRDSRVGAPLGPSVLSGSALPAQTSPVAPSAPSAPPPAPAGGVTPAAPAEVLKCERPSQAPPPVTNASWLERAVACEKVARTLDSSGHPDAYQRYQDCLQIYRLVLSREKSERLRGMLRSRMLELASLSVKVKERGTAPAVAPVDVRQATQVKTSTTQRVHDTHIAEAFEALEEDVRTRISSTPGRPFYCNTSVAT